MKGLVLMTDYSCSKFHFGVEAVLLPNSEPTAHFFFFFS